MLFILVTDVISSNNEWQHADVRLARRNNREIDEMRRNKNDGI